MSANYRKWYQVKPEFEGFHHVYAVGDNRYKNRLRYEYVDFIGHELITPYKFRQIIKDTPYLSDAFSEVNIHKDSVYWFFGVLKPLGDSLDYETCMDKVRERKTKVKQLNTLFDWVCHMVYNRRVLMSEKVIINSLSIDSLDACLEYYKSLLDSKNGEE